MISNILLKGLTLSVNYEFIYLFFIMFVGFFFLIKGADFFVDGSSSVAIKWGIPSIIVGLTIVSMGTSAPEASISVLSALAGENNLAVSNIIGSNMFNLLVVLGFSSIVAPVHSNSNILKRDLPINLFANLLLILLAISVFPLNFKTFYLSHFNGILMLSLFSVYIIYLVYSVINNNKSASQLESTLTNQIDDELKLISSKKILFLIFTGIIGITLGGKFVVFSATEVAEKFNISGNLIGLTIIALGTSLPELVTSVVAAFKGESDLALGNVIGSNIFNILLVLGLSSSVSSILGNSLLFIDTFILLIVTLITYTILSNKKQISRFTGFVFLISYLIYFIYIIYR